MNRQSPVSPPPQAVRPRRLVVFRGAPLPHLLLTAALAATFLALRLPFRSAILVNWDAVQLALGTEAFDLHRHQPHPPGYIGYVAVGWLLNHLTGDANTSLTLLSAVSGGIAPAAFFWLAARFLRRREALVSAVLFGTSPVLWYYSEVALTYAVEVAVALPCLMAAHRARAERSTGALLAASLLLAGLGALRQSAFVLLLPLWLWTVWPFPRRGRVLAAAALGAGTLAWLLPLLALAGGPGPYLRESAALASLTGGSTSVLSGNLGGIGQNFLFVGAGVVLGLNLGLAVLALAMLRGVNPLAQLTPDDRAFLALWAAPALLTYLLAHTGQLGYVLLPLPVGFLLVGAGLQGLGRRPDRTGRAARFRPPWRRAGLVATMVLVNGVTFLALPGGLYHAALSGTVNLASVHEAAAEPAGPRADAAAATAEGALARHVRQYALDANDAYWRDLIALIRRYDPETTAVLTVPGGPRLSGAFRHLAYYLPEYQIYALGHDQDAAFGYLFRAHDGETTYSVDRLASALPVLSLPREVDRVIIPDHEIARRLDPRIPREVVPLEHGTTVVIAYPPRTIPLLFARDPEHGTRIVPVDG